MLAGRHSGAPLYDGLPSAGFTSGLSDAPQRTVVFVGQVYGGGVILNSASSPVVPLVTWLIWTSSVMEYGPLGATKLVAVLAKEPPENGP